MAKVEHLPKLHDRLIEMLKEVGLPTDFTLELRGYSKTYNGVYYPDAKKIVLYVRSARGRMFSYKRLSGTMIHEAVHHLQFAHTPQFQRKKGVMHNKEFRDLYDMYHERFLESRRKIKW